jgi:hypothetical protein
LLSSQSAKVTHYPLPPYAPAQNWFPQTSPTILHEVNQSTIHMVNFGKPSTNTDHSHHIDIQYLPFKIRKNGDIKLQNISDTINTSDILTKPLGWVMGATLQ